MNRNEKQMGRFSVEVEVANQDDVADARRGRLAPARIRRAKLQGIVDSGAAQLVLPLALAKQLGLPIKEKKIRVRYADGRKGNRSEAESVRIDRLPGKSTVGVEVPNDERATIMLRDLVSHLARTPDDEEQHDERVLKAPVRG